LKNALSAHHVQNDIHYTVMLNWKLSLAG